MPMSIFNCLTYPSETVLHTLQKFLWGKPCIPAPQMSDSLNLKSISHTTTKHHSFKNPLWKTPHRRPKSSKQLLADENKRLAQKNQEDIANGVSRDQVNYFSLRAPPSLRPLKTYCDITGLPTSYRSPRNQLRFYNMEVYDVVKNMGPGVDQQYLGLRKAHVVLR